MKLADEFACTDKNLHRVYQRAGGPESNPTTRYCRELIQTCLDMGLIRHEVDQEGRITHAESTPKGLRRIALRKLRG